MAQAELIQKDLQTIEHFRNLLEKYHKKKYLEYVEEQLLLLYSSRLDPTILKGIKQIDDQLVRVLELLDQVRKAVSNLQGVSSLGNLAENLDAFQKHQKELLQEKAAAHPDPTLSESRIELVRRLSISSQTNPATIEYVVSEIIDDVISEDPETTLALAKQAIELLFPTEKPVPPEETVVILESLSDALQKTSESFAADVSIAADISPEVATYAVTAAYTASTITPSPQFEAALVTAEQSPAKAAKISSQLTDRLAQIQTFLTQLQSSLKYAQDVDRQVHKQISLDPNVADSQIHQAIGYIKSSLPLLVTAHQIVASKTSDSEKIRKIDELLAKIGGIAGYNIRASAVAAAQSKTVDYSQLASQAPADTQI